LPRSVTMCAPPTLLAADFKHAHHVTFGRFVKCRLHHKP
jgi:hypothetical protein